LDYLNKKKQPTQIYLYNDQTKQGLPAPKYYWKVVRNTQTKKGTAFIGINNPYLTEEQAAAGRFCTNISASITWLTWDATNIPKGYSFACEISDFRRTVTSLPTFPTNGILS
jgi:hypothetical protein